MIPWQKNTFTLNTDDKRHLHRAGKLNAVNPAE